MRCRSRVQVNLNRNSISNHRTDAVWLPGHVGNTGIEDDDASRLGIHRAYDFIFCIVIENRLALPIVIPFVVRVIKNGKVALMGMIHVHRGTVSVTVGIDVHTLDAVAAFGDMFLDNFPQRP